MNKFILQGYPNFFEGVQSKAQRRCPLTITINRKKYASYVADFDTEYYMKISSANSYEDRGQNIGGI